MFSLYFLSRTDTAVYSPITAKQKFIIGAKDSFAILWFYSLAHSRGWDN